MARVCRDATHARLLFVGAPPPRIADPPEKAARRGLAGHVFVWGHREDVPEILTGSDLVVDASYAGLGITGSMREALAVETPVVATDSRACRSWSPTARPGSSCRPEPRGAGPAILRVLENPARAQAMARAGRKRVEATSRSSAKLDRTEALYRRLLERA